MPRHEEATDARQPESPDDLARHAREMDERLTDEINYQLTQTELTRRVLSLAKHTDQIANYAQGLPTREDYDGLMAEMAAMRERMARLDTLLHSFLTRAAA